MSFRALVASSLAFGALDFLAGGFHGFSQGREAGLLASSAEAFVTSMALRAVREGRSNDAVTVLEGRLESEIVLNAFVHCTVAEIVSAAYASLAKQTPDVPFVYGETGTATGGPLPPHKTHQNGLSVDFFVPVRDADNQPARVPANSGNRWGYDAEFDAQGRSGDLRIDFDAMADHLLALAQAAEARGVSIRRIYFDVSLQKHLQTTAHWPQLRSKIPFSTTQGWWRHDEHYHVDFQLPCKPL